MRIDSHQYFIKDLFTHHRIFRVPKYQRGYAWSNEAIEDFTSDLSRCLERRKKRNRKHHFFGGIVAAKQGVPESTRISYEVIDGQQRLASFVMLAAAVVHNSRKLIKDLKKKKLSTNKERKVLRYLQSINKEIEETYLYCKESVHLEPTKHKKLSLSEVDDDFFQKVIRGKDPEPENSSNERIRDVWAHFQNFIKNEVLDSHDISQKAKLIDSLVNGVLAKDCTVIFMYSESRGDSYQIFQVLNDRGVSLTNGDLLRARTLELLDDRKFKHRQNEMADCWDKILVDSFKDTNDYLLWYFSSFEEKRPKESDLVSQFLEKRFKCAEENHSLTKSGTETIFRELDSLDKGFTFFRTISDGEWPYSEKPITNKWSRARLRLLMKGFRHTDSMPLLLALYSLGESHFAKMIPVIERFYFRYKAIGSAHIGPANKIYLRYSNEIQESKKFSIKRFRNDLKNLVEEKVPSGVFKAKLKELTYSPKGGNKHIRYLLAALDEYFPWLEKGAQGAPTCKDKTRVLDYESMTLEHVYPESAQEAEQDAKLERVKGTIGNLAILSQDENLELGNKPFSEKRKSLRSSSFRLNREIGQHKRWTDKSVGRRTDFLVEMALKVFVP